MARRETKSDEAKRTSAMKSDLFRYRSNGGSCDKEFADVVSGGLADPYLHRKTSGHDQPGK